MNPSLIETVRAKWCRFLPYWLLMLGWIMLGLNPRFGDLVESYFWLVGILQFVAFIYAIEPSVVDKTPRWHRVFWVLAFPVFIFIPIAILWKFLV
jgi:hypothetical protein